MRKTASQKCEIASDKNELLFKIEDLNIFWNK
jgi:hypothetical protein